jgi:NADH-quinone oxidoreductase subunit F
MEPSKVIVGLGSCGIAAGGNKVYQKIKSLKEVDHLEFILDKTSCIGMCYREPLVEVVDLEGSWLYGDVDEKKAMEIIDQHLVHSSPVREYLVKSDLFESADDSFFKGQVKIALRDCGYINPERI